MSLLSPIMLLGVLFGVIPLIIHLLNRSRYRVEPFGAMMFLEAATQDRAQTIKLQQVLLLSLRLLFFVLIAAALSRPVSRQSTVAAGIQPTTHVVVIDGSYSMQQNADGQPAFERAREIAIRIVDDMTSHDNMQIIWAGNKPRPLFSSPSFDRAVLRKTLLELQPGMESCNVPEGLNQALWALQASTLPRHRVYLLTDRQKYGWRDDHLNTWERLHQHIGILKVEPNIYIAELGGKRELTNAAPVSIDSRNPVVDIYRQTTFEVELENFGRSKRTVRIAFSVDGKLLRNDRLTLPPGRSVTRFDHRFVEAGDHYVQVELKDDDLAADNRMTQVFQVMDALPILLVEGNPSDDMFQSSGGLVHAALESAAEPGGKSLFAVDVIRHLDMDAMDLATLQRYRCIVLANVPSVSLHFAFQLEQFAERGGGILIGLGDRVVPTAYGPLQKSGRGIFPGELADVREAAATDLKPTFAAGRGNFILTNFDLSRTRVLHDVKVNRYWQCTPHDSAIRLATFGQDPFLLYKSYGRGRVALWTTSLGAQWTNLPVTRDYLPLLQDLVLYLSANTQPPKNLLQGESLVCAAETPQTGHSPPPATLTAPDGARTELAYEPEGNDWVIKWQQTASPGLYSVSTPERATRYFAVSSVSDEGRLSRYNNDTRDLVSRYTAAQFVESHEQLSGLMTQETGVREWWQWFLFACILLLCIELFFGRVFSS
jgi:hypothetical protein